DPNRLLDFLMLPMSPLSRFAANRLARVIAENPGVGGEAWKAAWKEIEYPGVGENDDEDDEPKRRAERVAGWRAFVEAERHDPALGMPRATARGIAGRVLAWASRRASIEGDPLYLALARIAADLDAAIEATSLERIDRLLIERMIEEALKDAAADPSAIAEAAPWRSV